MWILGAPSFCFCLATQEGGLNGKSRLIGMNRRAWVCVLLFWLCGPGWGQWEMQTSNTTADLRGIHAIGNGVAWASGTNGTILRTEDGGYVWQSCAVPPGGEKLD